MIIIFKEKNFWYFLCMHKSIYSILQYLRSLMKYTCPSIYADFPFHVFFCLFLFNVGKDKNTRLIGHVKANNYQQRQNADVWFYKTLRQSCRHNLTGNEWQASDIFSNSICNWKRINRNRGHLLNSHQKNYLSEKK